MWPFPGPYVTNCYYMTQTRHYRKRLRIISFATTTVLVLIFSCISLFAKDKISFDEFGWIVSVLCLVGFLSCGVFAGVVVYSKKKQDEFDSQLKVNQEKYQLIIAASMTGAWEHHEDTGYEWCSPEYYRMLGYHETDFNLSHSIREIWINLLHPDDRELAVKRFYLYLRSDSEQLYQNYFRMRHKTGRWVWIWSRGQTLRTPNGRKSAVTLGTHIDVTEKENLSIALKNLNARLLNYAHSNAHEVRAPLARLLGLLELSRLDHELDPHWCMKQMAFEAAEIDKVLKNITTELNSVTTE